MIVLVNVCVVKDDFVIVKFDCGIEGRIEVYEILYCYFVKDVLSVGQMV